MAVNLDKIRSDLDHGDSQIQTFALMCITRLTPQIVQSPDGIVRLRRKLDDLVGAPNPDVVFLARKAINHLERSFRDELGAAVATGPGDPPASSPAVVPPAGSSTWGGKTPPNSPGEPSGVGAGGFADLPRALDGPAGSRAGAGARAGARAPDAPPEAPGETRTPLGRREAEALDRSTLLEELGRRSDPVTLANLVIALLENGDAGCLDTLAPFLGHEDYRVRGNAVEVFGRFADETRIPALVPLLADGHNRVRANAVLALARFDHEAVPRALKAMLSTSLVSMRESAAWALSQLDRPWVLSFLLLASRDPYEGVRLRIVKALGRHLSRESVEALKVALNDIDINVCEAAAESLRQIKQQLVSRRDAPAGSGPPPAPASGTHSPARSDPPPSRPPAGTAGPGAGPPPRVPPGVAVEDDFEAPALPPPAPGGPPGMREELVKAYMDLGQAVYRLCRSNLVHHELLDSLFYDLLRCQDFLAAYTARRDRGDLDERVLQAIAKLEVRVRENLIGLGRQSAQLFEGRLIPIPDREEASLRTQLDQIRKAKRLGR